MAYNNVYVLESGGESVLIDTGPDYEGAREVLAGALGAKLPEVVLATHGHLDHAGLGRWWESRGVSVALHEADLHFSGGPQLADEAEFRLFAEFVGASGAPAELQLELLDGLRTRREWAKVAASAPEYRPAGRDGRWPSGLHYEPFAPSVVIAAARQALGAGTSALFCPGHTPGNLVAIVEGEGWLFSGDQLLPEISPTPAVQRSAGPGGAGVRFHSLPRFVESLVGLREHAFARCYPGHGEPFANVTEVIAANLSQIEQRTDRVRETLREAPATLFGACQALYSRAVAKRFWQIAATVQGHLDLLEERHEVRSVEGCFELT